MVRRILTRIGRILWWFGLRAAVLAALALAVSAAYYFSRMPDLDALLDPREGGSVTLLDASGPARLPDHMMVAEDQDGGDALAAPQAADDPEASPEEGEEAGNEETDDDGPETPDDEPAETVPEG